MTTPDLPSSAARTHHSCPCLIAKMLLTSATSEIRPRTFLPGFMCSKVTTPDTTSSNGWPEVEVEAGRERAAARSEGRMLRSTGVLGLNLQEQEQEAVQNSPAVKQRVAGQQDTQAQKAS